MIRVVILAVALILIACGYFHQINGGLLVELDGEISFSRDLKSSGSEDNLFLLIALYGFAVSLVAALLNRWVRACYLFNLVSFYLLLLLINLDTPILTSIKLGHNLLAVALIIVNIPLLILVIKKDNHSRSLEK
ncbi:hypothetical protein CS022_09815 [Veronia nyctiphanis]|uniref:Lipoprotein n=1 Tax=Veronia nyctiphanis TaxID=1278244 RepID=A0A4Q0YTS5_9GAMM|nr:hypothetical protein [Veronia nyctiphanis]RXJ73514.1 hypothetical protein CS022_09815 [Veronia nyctiphanis]